MSTKWILIIAGVLLLGIGGVIILLLKKNGVFGAQNETKAAIEPAATTHHTSSGSSGSSGSTTTQVYASPGDQIFAKGTVNIRYGAGTNHPIAFVANDGDDIGDLIEVVSADGGTAMGKWYKVDQGGGQAWLFIYASLATFKTPADASVSGTDIIDNYGTDGNPWGY